MIDVDINTESDPDRPNQGLVPNQGIEEIGLAAHGIEAIADEKDLVQEIKEEIDRDLDIEIDHLDIEEIKEVVHQEGDNF